MAQPTNPIAGLYESGLSSTIKGAVRREIARRWQTGFGQKRSFKRSEFVTASPRRIGQKRLLLRVRDRGPQIVRKQISCDIKLSQRRQKLVATQCVGNATHSFRADLCPHQFLTAGLQGYDLLNFFWVATDARHRPFSEHPFIGGRYVDDPAICVVGLPISSHTSEVRLGRALPRTKQTNLSVNEDTGDAGARYGAMRRRQDVLHLTVRNRNGGMTEVKRTNHLR